MRTSSGQATTIHKNKWTRFCHISWYFSVCRVLLNLWYAEVLVWFNTFIMAVPGKIGAYVRRVIIPFKAVGRSVKIRRGGWIRAPEKVSIGDNTCINFDCILQGNGEIEIGSNVLIGPCVHIYTENHNYRDRSLCIASQGCASAKVVIEDDVWLCAGSIVLPGVRVRQGTVAAAGAVITKDTEPYSVVAGVPAIKIGQRH